MLYSFVSFYSGSKKSYKADSKDLSLWNVIKRILTLSLLAWQDIVHIWKWSYFHLIEQEFSLFSRPRRNIWGSKSKHNGIRYFLQEHSNLGLFLTEELQILSHSDLQIRELGQTPLASTTQYGTLRETPSLSWLRTS